MTTSLSVFTQLRRIGHHYGDIISHESLLLCKEHGQIGWGHYLCGPGEQASDFLELYSSYLLLKLQEPVITLMCAIYSWNLRQH